MALNYSLGNYIEVLADRLTPEIVGEAELRNILELTKNIPGEISTFFGFECPMSAGRTDADFLFCSTQYEKQSKILAGTHDSISLQNVGGSAAWAQAIGFCKEWERSGSVSYNALQNIWLEFDVGQSSPPWDPSMFFGLDPDEYDDSSAMSEKVLEVLPALDGEAAEGQRLDTLTNVIAHLPIGAHIFQVGAMLSRKVPMIRVCIRQIKPESIPNYLSAIGWQGDISRISRQIDRLTGKFNTIDLDLDVGSTLGEKVGLEFAFGQSPESLAMMRAFLDECVACQLVEQTKADGLIAYNGLVHDESHRERWPVHVRKQSALLGPQVINFLACWIHHIKLDFSKDKDIVGKAYLAVQPGRSSRSELMRHCRDLRRQVGDEPADMAV